MTPCRVSTPGGTPIYVLSCDADLGDLRESSAWLRAFCPIHGGDHQRSLSVNKGNGWGQCFQCQARVLIATRNPAMAERLATVAETASWGQRARAVSVPPQPRPSRPLVVPGWQQEEMSQLRRLFPQMREALQRRQRGQASDYLQARGTSLDLALTYGIGYLPADLVPARCPVLARWRDRLIFPLTAPGGQGFIGRTLWGWQPGMDEQAHAMILQHADAPQRWMKTNPAGWFAAPFSDLAPCLILVEGAFDRLTLLAAGMAPEVVVALTGVTVQPQWFPPHVQGILLALDADASGWQATLRLAVNFARRGLRVAWYSPPQDDQGKDWNARWRTLGDACVHPLQDAYDQLVQRCQVAVC